MKKPLVIVGGKGSGEIAMGVFEEMNQKKEEWDIKGYINDVTEVGQNFGKYKVIGTSEELMEFINKGYFIHYTYHFNSKLKVERVDQFKSLNIPLECHATGIHPLAHVNNLAEIGYGSLLLPFASLASSARVGNFVHIYTNGFVGHDAQVEDYSTIAAGSIVGGRVQVKEGAHVGLNSCIREDVTVGEYSIIGMGSIVLNDVDPYSIVVGNPAKLIRSVK